MSRFIFWLNCLTLVPALLAGELRGVVCDMFGAPIDGAVVSAVDSNGKRQRATESRADGTFDIGGLPPGPYAVTFRKQGFHQKVVNQDVGSETRRITVALRHGQLFISKTSVIRGFYSSRQNMRPPPIIKTVAAFDSSISMTAKVSSNGAFTIQMTIPGEYLVGTADEHPGHTTKCRFGGNGDLFVDLVANTCVLVER